MTNSYFIHIKPLDSEVAFVNAQPPMITKFLFHVEFSKGGKTDKYLDKNDYLFNLYKSVKWNSLRNVEEQKLRFLEKTNGYISYIEPFTRCCAYVKVLRDEQNPQFEGQIMLIRFGVRIKEKIQEHFANGAKSFDKTFRIITEFKHGFPSFDKCYFTDKDINIVDKTLDLNSEFSYKTIDLLSLQRKDKLEKIRNSIF
jgi:hypothetical protein